MDSLNVDNLSNTSTSFSSPSTCISKDEYKNSILFKRLLNLDQIPEKIFIKGNLPTFTEDDMGRLTPRILSVVGSRKYSTYGKDSVYKLISELKERNGGEDIIILSGLALGIDSLSHKAALENNILTISIPGSGLSPKVIYPRSHTPLAIEILKKGGCLISELEDETEAAPWTFPSRNRITAALSDAVLIVEAEVASGTLITGRLALELGKDIGVVPGSIFSPTSKGTNELLKFGATPITNSKDLFDLLHLSYTEKNDLNESKMELDESEKKIFDLLSSPHSKDELLLLSGFTAAEFMMTVTNLEMKGFINESFGELRRVV